jgi:hypothetical protein
LARGFQRLQALLDDIGDDLIQRVEIAMSEVIALSGARTSVAMPRPLSRRPAWSAALVLVRYRVASNRDH